MIDFHNHILPGVDDGSKSMDMSLNMLKLAQNQGITQIVNTTHHMHPSIKNSKLFYKHLSIKYEELNKKIIENNISIEIHRGSEIYFHDRLDEIEINNYTTFGNKKYMLIEFPIIQFPENYSDTLFKLQLNGITPIIAHPERYRDTQKNIGLIENFIDKGYVIQIDAGSLLGHFGKKVKECAFKIIRDGYFHLIGSDAHNYKRNFCLKELIDLNLNIINTNLDNIFINNPSIILKGESINKLKINLKKRNNFLDFMKKVLNV